VRKSLVPQKRARWRRAKAIKPINPAVKVLYYRNVIVHYGSYAANDRWRRFPAHF